MTQSFAALYNTSPMLRFGRIKTRERERERELYFYYDLDILRRESALVFQLFTYLMGQANNYFRFNKLFLLN